MKLILIIFTMLFALAIVSAQDEATALEVITADNVDKLVEISFIDLETDDYKTTVLDASAQRLALAQEDGTVRLIDLISGETVQQFTTSASEYHTLQFSSDSGRLMVSSVVNDGRIYDIWDTTTGELLAKQQDAGRYDFAFDSALNIMWLMEFTSAGSKLVVKDALTGEIYVEVKNIDFGTKWNADGTRLLIEDNDDNIYLIDALSGDILATVEVGNPRRFPVAHGFSADESQFWLGYEDLNQDTGLPYGTVRFFDATTGEPVREIVDMTGRVESILWVDSGQKAFLIGHSRDNQNTLTRFWNMQSETSLMSLSGVGRAVITLAPDKTLVAIGDSLRKGVFLYDISEDTVQALRELFITRAQQIMFAPDGKWLAVLDVGGVRVLGVPVES